MEFLRHHCKVDEHLDDPIRRRVALGLPLGAMGSLALLGGAERVAAESMAQAGAELGDSNLMEQMIDLGNPVERFKTLFRFERDLQDEAITLTSYQFVMYVIAMGKRPQPVVRWQGMEFSYFRRVAEWTWRIHAHNVSYPLDLVSGEFVDAVRNPLTGESVAVEPLYLLNDPGVLHGPAGYLPLDVSAANWLKSFHVLRREGDLVKSEHIRPTPESWPQMFIESSCATASIRDFEDPAVTAIPFQTSGFYVFPFPAWMRMGNTEGVMLGAWSGRRIVGGPKALPRKFSDRLQGEYPELLRPRWQELDTPLSPVLQKALAG
jgi:hypothetical protein